MNSPKIVFCIFTENRSMAASMLSALAISCGWKADILFIPPDADSDFPLKNLDNSPNLYALSFASYERKQAFKVAAKIKKAGIKIIAGGIHATAMPEDLISSGHFDAIVQGDGMGVLESLLNSYQDLKDGQLIKGCQHQDKNVYLNYYFTESQEAILRETKKVDMLTSFGCPFACSYCGSCRKDYFKIPEEFLIDRMAKLARDYGIKIFTFQDDLLFANVERVRRISTTLEELFPGEGIGFGRSINARASSFTDELAQELVRLNITDVSFGIESASTKLLQFLNKKQTEEDCYRAVEICRKYGLYSRVNLMFGIPTQDRYDYESSLKFVTKSKPNVVNLFYFSPYPGTELYDYCFDNEYMPLGSDRQTFDWFDTDVDGIRHLQCRLNNVDYKMAENYMDRINSLYDVKNYLPPIFSEFANYSWVVIGSSVQIYFSQILQSLKSMDISNCRGYWDIDPQAAYSVENRVDFLKFDLESDYIPSIFVTYCHISSRDYQFFRELIDDTFGDIPLISISSMERHSIEDVQKMILKIKEEK